MKPLADCPNFSRREANPKCGVKMSSLRSVAGEGMPTEDVPAQDAAVKTEGTTTDFEVSLDAACKALYSIAAAGVDRTELSPLSSSSGDPAPRTVTDWAEILKILRL